LIDGEGSRVVRRTYAFALAALLLLLPALVAPPEGWAQKHKHKEKRFEPVVRADAGDYAGRYLGIDESYVLEIGTGADGTLKITSTEGARRAELRDIRLGGARLTATKVYDDGSTAKFEGLFAERVLNGVRAFGVVVSGLDIKLEGLTINRTFYRLFTEPRPK
jgi:hypothetical protein